MKFKQGLIAALAVIVVLVVVYILGYFSGSGSGLVNFKVENRAREKIASAEVEFDGGAAWVEDVNTGSSKKTTFYLRNESEYRLVVRFRNNRTLRTTPRTANPGAEITEIITDSAIVRSY